MQNFFEIFTVEYTVSFLLSVMIIALFSSRRLQEVSASPRGDEYRLIRFLSAAELAGGAAFRLSFVYYFFMLLLVFSVLCLFEPIVDSVVGSAESFQYKFGEPAWPIGVALFVVGVTPSTPFFEQIEFAIRRLAHRAADIPERFLLSITRIEQASIESSVSEIAEYRPLYERYVDTFNVLVSIGYSVVNAQSYARSVLTAALIQSWIDPDRRPSLWSELAMQRLKEVLPLVNAHSKRLVGDVDLLIEHSLASGYFQELKSHFPDIDWSNALEGDPLEAIEDYADRADAQTGELLGQWEAKLEDVVIAAKQTASVFVILSAHDPRPNSSHDKIVQGFMQLALRKPHTSVLNAVLYGLLGGTAACFVCVASYIFYLRFSAAAAVEDSVRMSLILGIESSLGVFLQFGTAALTAAALRYAWREAGQYVAYDGTTAPPTIQSIKIVLYAAVVTFFVNAAFFVAYNIFKNDLDALDALKRPDFLYVMGISAVWSFIPAVFSLGVCKMADLVACGEKGANASIAKYSILVAILSFIVLSINKNVAFGSGFFYSQLIAVSVFSTVGYYLFKRSSFRQMQCASSFG